jgi:DNA (cytosine-5)-methyltransferase 1
MSNNNLTVIDFFCGAGGFSEGFHQQGFTIVQGIDNWKPAIDTFNYNFKLNSKVQNILDFSNNLDKIENLPNTDIILGSPPCVSFSSSNNGGNANKNLGINLIETFLRVIAIKKHQPNSRLKAWFMENVTNSIKHTKDRYTFIDLNLESWAKQNKINPSQIAIDFKANHQTLNSADFGVAQARKRLFAGEIIKTKSFPELETQNQQKSIKQIFRYFPNPFKEQKQITDPNYKNLKITKNKLTDHFYDTGIYKAHWDYSEYCKTNHPYMGKMSFPENLNNPSRTVTATKLDNSREALIYKSEIIRQGNGQYRTPTVREIGVLMSFPISYQFIGMSENSKWRLVGNAVCPLVSSAIAKATLKALILPTKDIPIVEKNPSLENVVNLNNFKEKIFDSPPIRKKGSRFRRHPFKDGNMTVALSNYCLKENGKSDKKWRTTVTYGTGKNYKLQEISLREQKNIRAFIESLNKGNEFIEKVHNDFSEKIAHGKDLQDMYEKNYSNGKLHPVDLIAETNKLISKYTNGEIIKTKDIFKHKQQIHKKQLYALYVINQITTIANQRR